RSVRYDPVWQYSRLNAMAYARPIANLQRPVEKSLHVISDGRCTVRQNHHHVALLNGHPTTCHIVFLHFAFVLFGSRLPCRYTPLDWVNSFSDFDYIAAIT